MRQQNSIITGKPINVHSSGIEKMSKTFDSGINWFNKNIDQLFGAPTLIDHECKIKMNNPLLKGISKLDRNYPRLSYDETFQTMSFYNRSTDGQLNYMELAEKLLYEYVKLPKVKDLPYSFINDIVRSSIQRKMISTIRNMGYWERTKYTEHFLGEDISDLFIFKNVTIIADEVMDLGWPFPFYWNFHYIFGRKLSVDTSVFFNDNGDLLDCNSNCATIQRLRSRYNPITMKHDYYLATSENITLYLAKDDEVFAYRESKDIKKYAFNYPQSIRRGKSCFYLQEVKDNFRKSIKKLK